MVLAAIRRRAADQAGQQVDDRGKNAVFDHADAAAGGRIGLEPVAEGIQNILHHGVGIVVVVAVMVHLVAVDQLIKPLMALPVFQQGIIEFLRGAFFLLIHHLLQGGERIGGGGGAQALDAGKVVPRAALHQALATVGAVQDQRGHKRIVVPLNVTGLQQIHRLHGAVRPVFQLGLIGAAHFLERLEVLQVSGFQADGLAHATAASAVVPAALTAALETAAVVQR